MSDIIRIGAVGQCFYTLLEIDNTYKIANNKLEFTEPKFYGRIRLLSKEVRLPVQLI